MLTNREEREKNQKKIKTHANAFTSVGALAIRYATAAAVLVGTVGWHGGEEIVITIIVIVTVIMPIPKTLLLNNNNIMCIILYYRAFHNDDGCGTCARRGCCRPDFEIVCAPTSRTTGPGETKEKPNNIIYNQPSHAISLWY
jgi:hypothetical protein